MTVNAVLNADFVAFFVAERLLIREKDVLGDIAANADLATPQLVACLDIQSIESQRLGKQLLQFTRRDVADNLLGVTLKSTAFRCRQTICSLPDDEQGYDVRLWEVWGTAQAELRRLCAA